MNHTALTMMVLVRLMSGTGQVSAQDVLLGGPLIDATPPATSATPIADFIATGAPALALDPQDQRPVAIEYSDAHGTRAKIHKYASWATLPLMATEFALGEKLYNDTNSEPDSLRCVQKALKTILR